MRIHYSDFSLLDKAVRTNSKETLDKIKSKQFFVFSENLLNKVDFSACKTSIFRERMCFVGFGGMQAKYRSSVGPSLLTLNSLKSSDLIISLNRFKPTHIFINDNQITYLVHACKTGACALKFNKITIVSQNPLVDNQLDALGSLLSNKKSSTVTNLAWREAVK